jgi:uncharacterized membrane protein YoaK (UPF0700 family)
VDQPQVQLPEIPNNIRDLLSILLTCAAGSMDALSLFGLGGVFASGLSGNIVLGASLAQGESTKALLGIFIFVGSTQYIRIKHQSHLYIRNRASSSISSIFWYLF